MACVTLACFTLFCSKSLYATSHYGFLTGNLMVPKRDGAQSNMALQFLQNEHFNLNLGFQHQNDTLKDWGDDSALPVHGYPNPLTATQIWMSDTTIKSRN